MMNPRRSDLTDPLDHTTSNPTLNLNHQHHQKEDFSFHVHDDVRDCSGHCTTGVHQKQRMSRYDRPHVCIQNIDIPDNIRNNRQRRRTSLPGICIDRHNTLLVPGTLVRLGSEG